MAAAQQYKYLGTVLDDKLNFDVNTDSICKKANKCLFFLRKLRSFDVNKTIMKLFYSAFVESVLSFNIVFWFGTLSLSKPPEKKIKKKKFFFDG